jgi:thiol:disulfide interchange protein DsbA
LNQSLSAKTRALVEGKDFEQITYKGSSSPEIFEFFNYACGACYQMESFVQNYKKKHPKTKITLIPVELNPAWKIYVKAFYLGELLNISLKSHSAIFHRLHVEKKPIKDEDALKAFFIHLGVQSKDYKEANTSFALNMKTRHAKQLAKKYKIIGTPNFVVNQQYKLNNKALGSTEMIQFALESLTQKKTNPPRFLESSKIKILKEPSLPKKRTPQE